MRKKLFFYGALLCAVLVVSCSGSAVKDPITVGPDVRNGTAFLETGFLMANGDALHPRYGFDAAACVATGGLYFGYPSSIGTYSYYAFNAYIDCTPGGTYATAHWVWLSSGDDTAVFDTGIFGLEPSANIAIKYPMVDVLHMDSEGYVYAAVAFNWRWGIGLWNLGVVSLRWSEADFLNGSLGDPEVGYYFLPNPDSLNRYSHDIAFHPGTKDIYVVFSEVTGLNETNLKYFVLHRYGSPDDWSLLDNAGPFDAAYNPGSDRAYWFPRIDIGELDDMPLTESTYYGDGEVFVGVVATCYRFAGSGDTYYRVAGNYWTPEVDGYDDQTVHTTHWQNPDFDENDAGMPVIDISPDTGTNSHFFAIAYIQEVDDDHGYEVWEVDNKAGDAMEVIHSGAEDRCQVLPSIAYDYHHQGTDHTASVSFYENLSDGAPGTSWKPQTCMVNLDDDVVQNNSWGEIDTALFGTFDLYSMATNKAGCGSAICLVGDDSYWLLYTNQVDEYTTDIYAAFDKIF